MTTISAAMVKELRDKCGAGMMDCKKALEENNGDMKLAAEYLQIKGLASAAKRSARKTSEGYIGVYRHHDGKTAIMVEVNCETDFVARTEAFREFCQELAIHICGCKPQAVRREDLDAMLVAKQEEIFLQQAMELGKNEEITARIASGRVNAWLSEVTLLDQHWMGDSSESTVEQKRAALSSQTGENIRIHRFMSIVIGECSAE